MEDTEKIPSVALSATAPSAVTQDNIILSRPEEHQSSPPDASFDNNLTQNSNIPPNHEQNIPPRDNTPLTIISADLYKAEIDTSSLSVPDIADEQSINRSLPITSLFVAPATPEERTQEKQRTIQVTDIPIFLSEKAVRESFSSDGEIEKLNYVCKNGMYGIAYITFTTDTPVSRYYDISWGTYIGAHFVWVWPILLSEEKKQLHASHTLRISGLPAGMTGYTLRNVLTQTRAKTMIIPHNPRNYNPRRIAFLTFADDDDKQRAKHLTNLAISQGKRQSPIFLTESTDKICFRCGDPSHVTKECPQASKSKIISAAQAWKNRTRSYADAAKQRKGNQNNNSNNSKGQGKGKGPSGSPNSPNGSSTLRPNNRSKTSGPVPNDEMLDDSMQEDFQLNPAFQSFRSTMMGMLQDIQKGLAQQQADIAALNARISALPPTPTTSTPDKSSTHLHSRTPALIPELAQPINTTSKRPTRPASPSTSTSLEVINKRPRTTHSGATENIDTPSEIDVIKSSQEKIFDGQNSLQKAVSKLMNMLGSNESGDFDGDDSEYFLNH
ncbi:RNA-binding protein 34 [Rhizophagus clarus]|uniref:RNA-binding protein 34 n=1 Tax=Rhizophagus clarus TaxID=94130 RepID=A0A8H3M1L4_9GLOM|nr:RNA-binding protein 34 [Rhizophagus clarus]